MLRKTCLESFILFCCILPLFAGQNPDGEETRERNIASSIASMDSTINKPAQDTAVANDSAAGVQRSLLIKSTPPNASVIMNDSTIGVTPLLCHPDPGPCNLVLSLFGYNRYTNNLTITPNLNDTLLAVLSIEEKPSEQRSHKNSRRPLRLSLGALGIASTVTSVAMTVKMNQYYNKMEKSTTDDTYINEYMPAEKEYRKFRNLSRIFAGIALLSVTGVVVTYTF